MPLPFLSRNTSIRAPASAVPEMTGKVLRVRPSVVELPVSVVEVKLALSTAEAELSTTSVRRVAERALVFPAESIVLIPML